MTRLSSNNILGTLGPAYSFHDILRKEKINQLQVRYFDSFDDIFNALTVGEIQAALIATKNSIHGDVGENIEKISSNELEVIESFELPISLHLAARSPLLLSDIKKIYAHPVAWNECQMFLGNHHIEYLHSSSNSQALIDLISDSQHHTAAISGQEAINNSTLELIHKDIHDSESNITTFALVTKK